MQKKASAAEQKKSSGAVQKAAAEKAREAARRFRGGRSPGGAGAPARRWILLKHFNGGGFLFVSKNMPKQPKMPKRRKNPSKSAARKQKPVGRASSTNSKFVSSTLLSSSSSTIA